MSSGVTSKSGATFTRFFHRPGVRRRGFSTYGTSLALAALAVGCSSGPPLLRGAINADGSVNPDRGGRASPIVVRVYELKSVAAFNSADFFSLFDKEQETLGGELVGREEFQLQPAETRQYRRQLQPDTKFFGVVAAFRDLEQSRWRQPAQTASPAAMVLPSGEKRSVPNAVASACASTRLVPPASSNKRSETSSMRSLPVVRRVTTAWRPSSLTASSGSIENSR